MERIRLGMVGGGNDAFIGGGSSGSRRELTINYELVAGALSRPLRKNHCASGEAL